VDDKGLLAWLQEHLKQPGLPGVLAILHGRRDSLAKAALHLGNTEEQKTRVNELDFVLRLFEHYDQYIADTETETATG